MYNEGLRVSINSDDPSIYNYDYVSYDWFFVLALWSLNITDIENIIIFSIEDSFFTEDIKKEIKENFYRSISAWKIKYNKTLEASIEAAKEYLNTLF
jgi:adenosine deaminase CECR1